jgi:hypothetical protein
MACAFALVPSVPAGVARSALDDVPGTRIVEIAQPERDRVHASRARQLIDERFDREHVGVSAERA